MSLSIEEVARIAALARIETPPEDRLPIQTRVAEAQKAFDLARLRYEAGHAGYLDVLDAQVADVRTARRELQEVVRALDEEIMATFSTAVAVVFSVYFSPSLTTSCM